VVEERLDVVGRDDRVAVGTDEVAPSRRLQAAVKRLRDALVRAAHEANMLILRHPARDDAPRAVSGVVVDDDHLD
jgi:S-adenosylmethionine/arginine decarboxylase-like enzyme